MRLNIVLMDGPLEIELEAIVIDEGAADSRTEPGWGPEFEFYLPCGNSAEPTLKERGILDEAWGLAADALHEEQMERG